MRLPRRLDRLECLISSQVSPGQDVYARTECGPEIPPSGEAKPYARSHGLAGLRRSLAGHRAADYATMAESVVLALVIELGLRLTSVSTLLARLDRIEQSRWSVLPPSYRLDQFAAAAYRLLPIGSTCLRESLVLYALLRRRGATPKLCLGVQKDAGRLAAHAWIECAGLTTGGETANYFVMSRTNAPS
jgi:hypothetical protein